MKQAEKIVHDAEDSVEDPHRRRYNVAYLRLSLERQARQTIKSSDASDNLFINLAIGGGAQKIISGDSRLLKLKEFKGIVIVKVADFLIILRC